MVVTRIVLAWLVLVLGARSATAEVDAAKRLFDEGRALAAKGKHLEACVLFEKSYELEAAVGTQLNLADCAERDGKPRKAWILWIAAAEEFERASDTRAKFARGRADALAPKLATIVLKLKKPKTRNLVVKVAGRELPPAREIVERVDAGAVQISASAPCCKPFETTVTGELGKELEVEIPRLVRVAGAAPEPEGDGDEDESGSGNIWRTTAIVGGVTMVVFAGGFVYSYLKVRNAEDIIGRGAVGQEYDDAITQGERYATVATVCQVGFFVGTVVTAIAVYKVLTRPEPTSNTAWRLHPVLAPTLAGAAIDLRW